MPKASVKRLIECNKEQLVDLVLDIESYPKFIPYCLDAKIYEKKEEKNLILIIADLTIGKGPFKATYKSDVRFNKDTDTILVTNIKGPLKHLDNKWVFLEKDSSTEISFDIDFEIENRFLNIVMDKSFQYGLDKIADSFQKRANDLFKGR
ncbi:coenzyme Q-binding protein COQ10 [Candidatus Pelagibacter ubique]|uniref:Coenzyme Q-binding protein COQ10 n=1 Tax=Pelagibacter ubique TaxID=198252 RepID=A0ABX1T3D2_PELUQ|nr:type II toxin-antitoxin system RatA family toxin [Candidatus Pelagibacter ubique]NMN68071.1 coenzyme Q-binding protein COQ10 [Candidatus Pelagibacter ubique]